MSRQSSRPARSSFRIANQRAWSGLGNARPRARLDPPLAIGSAAQHRRGTDILPADIDGLRDVPARQAGTQCDPRTGDDRRWHGRRNAAEERARDEGGYGAVAVIAGIAIAVAAAAVTSTRAGTCSARAATCSTARSAT